jgi:uncharacterized membrane protein (DUF106 family)
MFGLLPFEEIFIWAVISSAILALIYRIFIKPSEMAGMKKDIQFFRDKIKEANKLGDTKKSQEFLGGMMKVNQKMFSKNMKPMIVSMVFSLAILGFIGQQHAAAVIKMPFVLPFIGPQTGWLVWYIIATLPFTFCFRKLLGVD